jgi:hypothetical protein
MQPLYPWTEQEKLTLTEDTPLIIFPGGDRPREIVLFVGVMECHDGVNPTCVLVRSASGFGSAWAWRAVAPIRILDTLPYDMRREYRDR